MTSNPVHIRLRNDTGIQEEMEVAQLADDEYELLFSPVAVMGLAAGDVIRIQDYATGAWQFVRSGGQVCVQFFVKSPTGTEIAQCEAHLAEVGARIDNRRPKVFSASISAQVGYSRLMRALETYLRECPQVYWQFGNAIDQDDEALPGWEGWKST